MYTQPTHHKRSQLRRWVGIAMMMLLGIFAFSTTASAAEGTDDAWAQVWDALIHGKPTLNFRARVEIADSDAPGLERADSYTFRTRLGYGTKPLWGVSVYADFENIAAAKKNRYYGGVSDPNGRTLVADPTKTELNQAFMKIDKPEWLGTSLVGGRQRVIYDDARFIGNVGWRQNEQTYDGARLASSIGVEGLDTSYLYIGQVRRIFGNQDYRTGGPLVGLSRNWNSKSHSLRGSYSGFKYLKPTAFVYLLDLYNKDMPNQAPFFNPLNQSSATYGFRLTGGVPFGEEDAFRVNYVFSYAYQTEFGDNPADYGANYVMAGADIGWKKWVQLGAGYELLGSDDDSDAVYRQFRTPLATLHKFNGFADVFLGTNGGPDGLQDIHVWGGGTIPFVDVKLKLIYHYFKTHRAGGVNLGQEFDGVLTRSFGKHVDMLFKFAYFDGESNPGYAFQTPYDIYRTTLDFVLKF